MIEAMIHAVEAAARATRFVQSSSRVDGIAKDDRSPVTVADWASQAVVSILLGSGHPIVGEEDAGTLRAPESEPLRERVVEAVSHALARPASAGEVLDAIDACRAAPADMYYTLDPVDGTKGFLRRQQYAISLAFLRDGVVRSGVVGCPNLPADDGEYDTPDPLGCLAWATFLGGAQMRHGHGPAHRLAIAPWRPGQPVRSCESVESAHSKHDLSAALLEDLGAAGRPARLDSQCKYVVVARGGADVYMRLPVKADYREKIWDHAAGALVASEAGARVVDVDGQPLFFGRSRELTENRGVLAGHPEVVRRLLEAFAARVR